MYPIIAIPNNVAEWPESLGSKEKFWFWHEDTHCLFKTGRPQTGENWAEKVVNELCRLLNLPHAHYELAICNVQQGVITPTIVPEGGQLILGNQLLTKIYQFYPVEQKYRQTQHTLQRIEALMTKHEPPIHLPLHWQPVSGIKDSFEVFIGYLMLDAWIANQDRHHENWGVIEIKFDHQVYLAPTFDHAASLGRSETDENRLKRLTTHDENYHITSYIQKAKSAFYERPGDSKPLSTLDAFYKIATRRKAAARAWLRQLEQVTGSHYQTIFQQLPKEIISPVTIDFSMNLLNLNQQRLLSLREKLL